jgi:hypothetical protein
MAINSLSTGWRPGVCTSSTRPTAPYEGQVIYETDTDLSYVWGGAAWQQVSGGTAVGNSGLVYITGGTSIVSPLDGIFTSTYDNYRIVITKLSASTPSLTNFQFRNTSNATDSSNVYYTAGRRFDNGVNYDFSQGPVTYATTGINITNNAFGSFTMDIINPRLTAFTTVILNGIGAISAISTVQSSSLFNSTTQFAGIAFGQSAGSISSGEYTVYGYRK